MSEGQAGPSNIIKHKSGKPLKSGQKHIILNVFNGLLKQHPTLAIADIVKLTSEFTGVSIKSVWKVRSEHKETGAVKTPQKKVLKPSSVIGNIDDFTKSAIRAKIHQFFLENIPPTLDKVLSAVNSDPNLPDFKRTTFYRLLLQIGLKYVKRSEVNVIIDRDDIVLWRRRYLRSVRQYRAEGKKFYYLDETWVNAGHTTSKVWKDTTVESKEQAFRTGLSRGLKTPTGKGKRLIITHIGSDTGFVDGGLLMFESKKTSDYHEDMNGEVFQNWFSIILTKLEPHSLIVMDNAPYHSVRLYRRPNTSWRKQDIVEWLQKKNLAFDEKSVKAELVSLAQQFVDKDENKYVVDDLASKAGHEVLRLPPYHSNLNPIELVWGFIKGFVARNNTFKLSDVDSAIAMVKQILTMQ